MQPKGPCCHLDSDTQTQIALKRQLIHDIRVNHASNLTKAQQQAQSSASPPQLHHSSIDTQTDPNSLPCSTAAPQVDKNPGVSDTNRMVFDKKFKNYLNHRQEYLERARGQSGTQGPTAKRAKKEYLNLGEAEYYNEEEVLSNTGSDYQYQNAGDMQAAYEEMTTGKKRKGGRTPIFPPELYENQLRRFEFDNQLAEGSEEEQEAVSVSKDRLLNYLFDEPILMMLYSINPYQLGDQLSDLQTLRNDLLNYQEFSYFLLSDREPTYVDYSEQNLAEARKLGRGIKCAPIIAKWVDDSGIFEFLLETYRSLNIRGDGLVDRSFLARKLRKEALERRITETEVIEIVNVNKMVPLNRLLYELEFEQGRQDSTWSEEEFIQFLTNYSRKITPEKDRLITKLILTGKYDSSYIFVVSQEAIELIKHVFDQTSKFAEYFVLKDRLLQNIRKDPRYGKVQSMLVRTEANRYMKKETVEHTLARMETEAETYLDIEEVLDFLTNRGRPKGVEHQVYLQNLHRQLAIIEEEERIKLSLREGGSDTASSDEELGEVIRSKRIKRKQNKLKEIRSGNNFDSSKKFNVTIPSPFQFDSRDRHRKVSIREKKMQVVLQEKERQLQEAMKPIPFKDAPDYIKENQYRRRPAESKKEEPFAARPLPWYCEINLMPRIEKQNEARSIRIREEVITKHTNYELPDGVQRMLKRQEEREEKRAAKARTASTGRSICTFVPKISQGVPKFLVTHEDIKFDLENAKDAKQPLQTMPFSFANRPEKSKTTHQQAKPRPEHMRHSKHERVDNQEEFQNIPKTEKFEALVELRRRQLEEKERERLKEKRSEAVRKLRETKFSPVVWRALKNSSVDPARSRAIVAGRVKEFKREERHKKEQYENQMIRILTNVYEKPLLLESGVARGSQEEMVDIEDQRDYQNKGREFQGRGRERQFKNEEEYLEADYQPRGDMRLMLENGHRKQKHGGPGESQQQQNMDDEHRRAVVEGHQLGQYLPEGYEMDYDDEDVDEQEQEQNMYENGYNQEYDQHDGHPGNLHTS